MTSNQRMVLIAEIRTDYQIPPYQTDETIGRAVDKVYARLCSLFGKEFDPSTDKQGKMLLENGVYYELYHRYEEFEASWQTGILSWQLGGVVEEGE